MFSVCIHLDCGKWSSVAYWCTLGTVFLSWGSMLLICSALFFSVDNEIAVGRRESRLFVTCSFVDQEQLSQGCLASILEV